MEEPVYVIDLIGQWKCILHLAGIVNKAFRKHALPPRASSQPNRRGVTVSQVEEEVVMKTVLLLQKVYHSPIDSYFPQTSQLSSHPFLGF